MQNRLTTNVFRKPVIKLGLYIYLSLTIFERYLNHEPFGSLLKVYGLVLLFFWLLGMISQGRQLKFGSVTISLMLWLFFSVFSLIWTPNFAWGQYYVLAIGNMVMILLMVDNIDWNPDDFKCIVQLFKVSTSVFAILMIRNASIYHGMGIRYTLSLGESEVDPNNIAGLLIPGLLIALHSLLSRKNKKLLNSLPDIVIIVIISVAISLSGSRGGILGLLIGISAYLFHWIFKTKGGNVFAKLLLVILLLMLMTFVITSQINEELLQRIMPTTYFADGGSGRLVTWARAIKVWTEAPLQGCGIGGFSSITGKGVHNTYLLVITELGIIGFLCWFSAIILLLISAWRRGDYLIVSLLLSMMTIIFFLDAYQKKFMWNVLLIAVVRSKANQAQHPDFWSDRKIHIEGDKHCAKESY